MNGKPLILGVITARAGSEGIPGKNIKLLGGKPLIAYTIEAAKKSKTITHLVVSTDGEEIAKVARECGADVPFVRPAELAADKVKHVPVMIHAVDFMEKKLGLTFDATVILQPTAPFRLPEDIDETVKKLLNSKADSAVSLVEVEGANHPIKVKKLVDDRVYSYCMEEEEGIRRQDLPRAYRRNGAVYVIRRDVLMKQKKLYGDYIMGHVVAEERSIDIDIPRDWVMAELMLEDLKKKGYKF